MKNIAEMTDEQIVEFLDEYKAKLDAGVVDFTLESDVPTEDVVFGLVALEYLEQTNPEEHARLIDLSKYVQGEMLSRAGQMPLK